MGILRMLLVVVVGTGVVGCSGTTVAPGGEAGAGAGGNGAAHVSAQAAFTIGVGPSAVQAGTSCPVFGESYELGSPGPSELIPGTSVADGDNGAMISCSVTGADAGPYRFSGSIHATTAQGEPVNLTFTDGSVGRTEQGSATVTVYASQLAGTLVSQMPCDVLAIQAQVKPGAVWARFSCSEVSRGPTADCAVSGYFVLENCEGS